MERKLLILLGAVLLAGFSSCKQDPPYERLIRKELSKGVRQDSLFLGLYLGMPRESFYRHCYNLNQKQLVRQGHGTLSVEYYLPDQDPQIIMNFYPDFFEEKISQMPTSFVYRAWAPWNRKMFADSLQQQLMPIFMKWYGGNDFIFLKKEFFGPVYAKIDGNRRIVMSCKDDQHVLVVYTDLLAEKKAMAAKEQQGIEQ